MAGGRLYLTVECEVFAGPAVDDSRSRVVVCVALRLDSLAPPRIGRDASGQPVVRARQTAAPVSGWHTGACAYDAASETGMITVAATTANGLQAELRATGLGN